MAYNNIVGTADLSEQQIPVQEIREILKTAPEQSVVLTRARRVPMSARSARQSVLSTLPDAFWVTGETGMKQTTKAAFSQTTITAEELAVIVPIPDALIADSNVPLWNEVRPLLTEAIGKKIDEAALFGTDKPASWPDGIVPAAIAAGNVAQLSDSVDLPGAFLDIATKASKSGAAISSFVAEPGLNWQLRGLKDANGQYLFGAPTAGGPATLFGFTLDEVRNGAWNAEAAVGLGIDWSRFVVGVRQDITFDLFSEGVISDDAGKVVLNLMQQDTKALRVVFRVGFQVMAPMIRLGGETAPYPAGVVTPATQEL